MMIYIVDKLIIYKTFVINVLFFNYLYFINIF